MMGGLFELSKIGSCSMFFYSGRRTNVVAVSLSFVPWKGGGRVHYFEEQGMSLKNMQYGHMIAVHRREANRPGMGSSEANYSSGGGR
jgi:hypothetical protein